MKVFGIGLNKTGTTTLGKALEHLGFEKHVSYNLDLVHNWKKKELQPIFDVADQNDNFEDWPWPMLYKELYNRYDTAKFILTTRKSPDVWFESLCKHADRTGPTAFRELIYGYSMPHNYKKEHIDFYNFHNQAVSDFFNKYAPEKLLQVSWEEGDEWEILCKFLQKDIPEISFPFLNKSIN